MKLSCWYYHGIQNTDFHKINPIDVPDITGFVQSDKKVNPSFLQIRVSCPALDFHFQGACILKWRSNLTEKLVIRIRVYKGRDKGRSKNPGTNSSVPGRPRTK